MLSKTIDETGTVFEEIAEERKLDFHCEKENRQYVELGGGNKMCTFKIWYDSEVLDRRTFTKIQIDFVEHLCLPPMTVALKGILTGTNEEIDLLFPEYKEYSDTVNVNAYDVREILCEKVRSILTRVGVKARDFVDIYLINREFGIDPEDYTDCTIEKIQFALKLYRKYRLNLERERPLLESDRLFTWGDERDILLTTIDEAQFYQFNDRLLRHLENVAHQIRPQSSPAESAIGV